MLLQTDLMNSQIKRRCIRDKNYKLILNGDTNSSIMKPISYRKNMNTMKVLNSLNKKIV